MAFHPAAAIPWPHGEEDLALCCAPRRTQRQRAGPSWRRRYGIGSQGASFLPHEIANGGSGLQGADESTNPFVLGHDAPPIRKLLKRITICDLIVKHRLIVQSSRIPLPFPHAVYFARVIVAILHLIPATQAPHLSPSGIPSGRKRASYGILGGTDGGGGAGGGIWYTAPSSISSTSTRSR